MTPVITIIAAEVVGPHQLRLLFNNGEKKVVYVRELIAQIGGPMFTPLLDEDYFARVSVDPVCGTVVWPNGADLAPDALYALENASEPVGEW